MSVDDEDPALALEKRLKAALWYSIGQIVDDETLKHSCGSINATPQFIGALMELVWAQIETASKDLESFAKHAGRSTIQVQDVMLLARRNDGLREILEDYVENKLPAVKAAEGRK